MITSFVILGTIHDGNGDQVALMLFSFTSAVNAVLIFLGTRNLFSNPELPDLGIKT